MTRPRCTRYAIAVLLLLSLRGCSTFSSSTRWRSPTPASMQSHQHLTASSAVDETTETKDTTSLSSSSSSPVAASSNLHLLSLQWSSDKDPSNFSKPTRDLWKWKDAVLGDGRDFFVPRPRTLRALQQYLLLQQQERKLDGGGVMLEECVILSNCARFEILLVTNSTSQGNHNDSSSSSCSKDMLCEFISRLLLAQVRAHESRRKTNLLDFAVPFDWPGNIQNTKSLPPASPDDFDVQQVVKNYWQYFNDPEIICRHLCGVAAGLAPRPSRPDRPVAFRPFSSRDAHILLQLKRTIDTFVDNSSSASSPRLGKVLRFALEAGKAARDVQRVPALQELRAYGTGDSSYGTEAPVEVMERAKAVSI